MEAIKLEGIVYKLDDTKEVGEKAFKVREMILEVEPHSEYPKFITIQGTKETCDKMDELKKGAEAIIHVNLNGRLYKDKEGIEKSFNSLTIWKFESKSSESNEPAPVKANDVINAGADEEDSLPF